MFPLRYNLDFSVKKMYVYFVYADKLKGTKLVFLAPAEGFWMNMKIALGRRFHSCPAGDFPATLEFYLSRSAFKRKKVCRAFCSYCDRLFLIGAAFCFFIVLPFALDFLLSAIKSVII